MSKLLDILLQRNDASVSWGFCVRGGRDFGTFPVISAVTFGTLASQHLNVGDKILEIGDIRANLMLESEVNGLIDNDRPSLHLLVEKLPAGKRESSVISKLTGVPFTPNVKHQSYETSTEQECVKEGNEEKHSTKIWLRETNKNTALGEYDLQVNFQRTKYKGTDHLDAANLRKESDKNRNQERMRVMSENFDKVFREKIGEWLEENMFDASGLLRMGEKCGKQVQK